MLAEIGRRALFALTRATDVVHKGAHSTVLHLRRIVGALSVAVVRVKRKPKTWSGTTKMWPVICGGPMAPAQTCPMSVWLTSAT
jgi:hypothetical protein